MKVYAAIKEVMKDLGELGISKDSTNKDQGYKFRGIEAVYLAINPLLVKHNLVVLPRHINRWSETRPTKSGGTMCFTTVEVEFDFVQTEDFSKHTVRMCGEGMDTADKATNKANSAAYKYAMFETFCVPTEAVDGDSETPSMNKPANIDKDIAVAAQALNHSKTKDEARKIWTTMVQPIFHMMDAPTQKLFNDCKDRIVRELQ